MGELLTQYLLFFFGGIVFGWGAYNLAYGRKGCDSCFIGLIRGKKCSECADNKVPPEVKSP